MYTLTDHWAHNRVGGGGDIYIRGGGGVAVQNDRLFFFFFFFFNNMASSIYIVAIDPFKVSWLFCVKDTCEDGERTEVFM